MGVAVSASTTHGKTLDQETMDRVLSACQMIIKLDASRQKVGILNLFNTYCLRFWIMWKVGCSFWHQM